MNINGIPIIENSRLRYDQMIHVDTGGYTRSTSKPRPEIHVGEVAHLRHLLWRREWRVGLRAHLHATVAAAELRIFGSLEENAA